MVGSRRAKDSSHRLTLMETKVSENKRQPEFAEAFHGEYTEWRHDKYELSNGKEIAKEDVAEDHEWHRNEDGQQKEISLRGLPKAVDGQSEHRASQEVASAGKFVRDHQQGFPSEDRWITAFDDGLGPEGA